MTKNSERQFNLALYGGSFNPPCCHHLKIALELWDEFDVVSVVPCGYRPDKASVQQVSLAHRKEMVQLAFNELPMDIVLDLHDFDREVFTPTYLLQDRYEQKYPGVAIWHVIGPDIILGGKDGQAEIQRTWNHGNEIWNDLNFAVLVPENASIDERDLPPFSKVIRMSALEGRGTLVRQCIAQGKPIDDFVPESVSCYIQKNQLYRM